MSDNINNLLSFIRDSGKGHVKVQTAWAKVKSVDWDNKMMVVTGVLDDLDYEDVLLGIGNVYRKPAVGTLCLIGLIENNEAAAHLLDAKALEEVNIEIEGGIKIVINNEGYYISKDNVSLRNVFDKLKTLLRNFKVNTPSGPSTAVLPDTLLALDDFETTFKQLLNGS